MLIIHIVSCALSYVFFGLAFVLALTYMRRAGRLKRKAVRLNERFPFSLHRLDLALYNSLLTGSVLLAIGLPTGLIAQENMTGIMDITSLRLMIPMVVLSFYLCAVLFRYLRGMQGMQAARMATIGFASMTFALIFELVTIFQTAA